MRRRSRSPSTLARLERAAEKAARAAERAVASRDGRFAERSEETRLRVETRHVPPELTAEMIRLRRKVSDLGADNALLTQNFLMVQSRYREVAGQRDEERASRSTELEAVATQADATLAGVRETLTKLLSSEMQVRSAGRNS